MNKSIEEKYRLSFTSGALLANESSLVVDAYGQTMDWSRTRQLILDENRLQTRTIQSSKILLREIIGRLKTLTKSQIDFFRSASLLEQKSLLWFAICKHYKFIGDFAIEVVREKYLKLDYILSRENYDRFFNDKAEWHPELEKLTERSKQELRKNLFRIMREAEIIDSNNTIISAILSKEFIELIKADSDGTLAVFPVPESLL